jgi:hypothetical protein
MAGPLPLIHPRSPIEFIQNGFIFATTIALLPFLLIGVVAIFATLLVSLNEVAILFIASLAFYLVFIATLVAWHVYFGDLHPVFICSETVVDNTGSNNNNTDNNNND